MARGRRVFLPDLCRVASFDCVSLRLRDDSLVQLGNMLWLRDHDLTNQVNECEQLGCNLRIIVEVNLARMHGTVSYNADNI